MKIKIDANPSGPVRILPELPDSRLAVLEGLNGIGKTIAVRVLQLCVGEHPYRRTDRAWDSLCANLGEFRVSISELAGGETIKWHGDTRDWINLEPLTELPFRSIDVNERRASIADVRKLLLIDRLAGDETLIETLAQRADHFGALVQRWRHRVADSGQGPLAELETLTEEISRVATVWSPARYADLTKKLEEAKTVLESTAAALETIGDRVGKLETAKDFDHRLQQAQTSGPNLRSAVNSLDDALENLQRDADALDKELRNLAERVAKTEPALKELRNAQRTVHRNRRALERATNAASSTAAKLGIEPTAESWKRLREEVAAESERLRLQRLSLDAAPAMLEMLGKVRATFEGAEVRGLGEEVALEDPRTALELSVQRARAGVENRLAALREQPSPPAARELDRAEKIAAARSDQLMELKRHIDDMRRFRRLTAKNEQRVEVALKRADPDSIVELTAIEARRRENREEILALAAERAALKQQLDSIGPDSPSALEAKLLQICDEIGITSDSIDLALNEAHKEEQQLRHRYTDAERAAGTLRREVSIAKEEIVRSAAAFAEGGPLRWATSGLPHPMLNTSASHSELLESLSEISSRAETAAERLARLRRQMAALESACAGIARHLRGQDYRTEEYVPELERWFGARFSKWFSNDQIRRALLPGADNGVQVDVAHREVTWHAAGAMRSKPLDAFSSGEQAFAYTRARLEILDEGAAVVPNRLVVLDEFGAFIAQNRLAQLFTYLKEHLSKAPHYQILVILPVNRDYKEESENAVGLLRDHLLALARQVEERGYAVRALD